MSRAAHNEPKRRFYEDEHDAVTVPGTVAEAAADGDAGALAPPAVVNGVTVRTAPSIEAAMRSARGAVHGAYAATHRYLHGQKEAVYEKERAVSGTVAALHDRREDLMPNGVYIAVAALSGTIAARGRGVVARALLPVALGAGAFRYFLPQTFANTADFVWRVEQSAAPELAQQQTAAVAKAQQLAGRVEEQAASGQRRVAEGVERMRHRLSRATGLNIDEEVSKK